MCQTLIVLSHFTCHVSPTCSASTCVTLAEYAVTCHQPPEWGYDELVDPPRERPTGISVPGTPPPADTPEPRSPRRKVARTSHDTRRIPGTPQPPELEYADDGLDTPPTAAEEKAGLELAFAVDPEIECEVEAPLVNPHVAGQAMREAARAHIDQAERDMMHSLVLANHAHTRWEDARKRGLDTLGIAELKKRAVDALRRYRFTTAQLHYALYLSQRQDEWMTFVEEGITSAQRRGKRYGFFTRSVQSFEEFMHKTVVEADD